MLSRTNEMLTLHRNNIRRAIVALGRITGQRSESEADFVVSVRYRSQIMP